MSLERVPALKNYRIGNSLPLSIHEEPRKPFFFVSQLLEGGIEAKIRQTGDLDSEAADYAKESMRYLATKMTADLNKQMPGSSDLLKFPLPYSIDFAIRSLPPSRKESVAITVDEIAENMMSIGLHDINTQKVSAAQNYEALLHGTPLSIFFLYSDNHFFPTLGIWWEYRRNLLPLYERVGEALSRYLDPDFIANANRVEFSYPVIKSWSSK